MSASRSPAICLLAYIYLAVTAAVQRQQDAGSGLDAELIPITVPELLRLLRGPVIPPPRKDLRRERVECPTDLEVMRDVVGQLILVNSWQVRRGRYTGRIGSVMGS